MALRKWTALISLILFLAALSSLAIRGLNWGLDFTGGTQIQLSYTAPVDLEQIRQQLDKVSLKQAFIAGTAQCVALIPGVSRSGAAIVGGLIGGMNRVTATAFSFYLAIPILGGAAFYKLITDRGDLATVSGEGISIIVGLVTSFIVALLAISWLLRYVSTHSFRIFVYWRIALGILVLAILV